MDAKTKGAWLLSQSKILDGVAGPAAARLENISFAGKIGRFYNLLRRNVQGELSPTIPAETIETSCKLNGIDRATRNEGLRLLKAAGRIDVAQNGSVSVLGSSVTAVLETAASIFDETKPSADEQATLSLSEAIADRPKT